MRISMVEIILDARKKEVEDSLKKSELVDDYEIEELDDRDVRKSVVIVFKELVDSRFLDGILKEIFPFEEIKQNMEE